MTKKKINLIIAILGLIISGLIYLTSNSHPVLLSSSPTPTTQIATDSAVLANPLPAGFVSAQVTKVVDGDTIDVSINGEKKTIRYIGVNTPETVDPRRPVQCFGKEASDENKKLLAGKIVYLEKDISETDKYDRLLRYVYLPIKDGLLFINDYLVREGFAEVNTYPPDVKYIERYTQAQTEARENNRGLWDKCKI